MQKTIIFTLCWLILICLGCSNRSALMKSECLKNELPVIIHLEKRNEVVTIMSGREGLVYTVKTKDGRVLGQYLSEQEFQTKLPDIYNLLKKSYAENNERRTVWGDY